MAVNQQRVMMGRLMYHAWKKFWIVNALVNSLYNVTVESTFENVCLRSVRGGPLPRGRRCHRHLVCPRAASRQPPAATRRRWASAPQHQEHRRCRIATKPREHARSPRRRPQKTRAGSKPLGSARAHAGSHEAALTRRRACTRRHSRRRNACAPPPNAHRVVCCRLHHDAFELPEERLKAHGKEHLRIMFTTC